MSTNYTFFFFGTEKIITKKISENLCNSWTIIAKKNSCFMLHILCFISIFAANYFE